MSARRRPPTAVFGAGRLARAMLPGLAAAGYSVTHVCAPRRAKARGAARLAAGARETTSAAKAARGAELLLLAVPDRALASLAATLAATRIDWPRRTILHHSGVLGVAPLEPLARAGAAVGVLHPLQCLGDTEWAARVLAGSGARLEGDRRGRAVALDLARALRLRPLAVPRELSDAQRAAYHAAAALVSNDLLALLSIGIRLFETVGIERTEATRALAQLARGTLLQAERGSVAAALTGPVPRGDDGTLARHLERLAALGPGPAEAHRALSAVLLELAGSLGHPPEPAAARRLRRLLASPVPAGRGVRRGL